MKEMFKELIKFTRFSWTYLKSVKIKLFVIVLFNGISIVMVSYSSIITKNLIDKGVMNKDLSLLIHKAIVLATLAIVAFSMNYFASIISFRLRNEVDYRIKLKTMESTFQVKLEDFKRKGEGYFLSRIFTEAPEIAESIVSNLWAMLLNLLWFVIGFIFAFKLSPFLTLMTVAFVPLHLIIDVRFGQLLKELNRELKESEGNIYEQVSNVLKFTPIVRLMDMFKFLKQIYSKIFKEYLDKLLHQKKKSYSYGMFSNITQNLYRISLLLVGGILIIRHKLTIGGYIGFSNLIWQVIQSSEALFSIITSIYTVNSTIERFEELRESGTYTCKRVKLSGDRNIYIKMVNFGYNGRNILKNFNLTIKSGEKVLISGPNGSGKTTLCHLIAGLLCPENGEIRTLPIEKFSYVPVNTPVLPGNIKKQITMGIPKREQKLEKLWGFLSVIHNKTGNLSQGEIQKINILRTLVKDAEVYIFDEPFQHLDRKSTKILKELIKHNLKGKTVIIVSHREDIAGNMGFDKIINMGGKRHEDIKSASR